MRVYKFLDAKWAKEAILRHRLKISLSNFLNDPWDGQGLNFSCESHRVAWARTLIQFSQTKGIMCFSSHWDDPVQWSHYADQHRGIALGFDISNEFLTPVTYQTELVDFDDFFKTSGSDKEEFTIRAMSTKYKNWHYEQEVRLFTSLEDADQTNGHFFKEFDADLRLREVIFGLRYNSPEDMAFILASARKNVDIECWKASMGNQTFEMVADPDWKYYRSPKSVSEP